MCDFYVSALFVLKSYLDNVLSDIFTCPARFLLLLLLFALNKIAEISDSGAESNQKAIRN
jgi:hypothetical protein